MLWSAQAGLRLRKRRQAAALHIEVGCAEKWEAILVNKLICIVLAGMSLIAAAAAQETREAASPTPVQEAVAPRPVTKPAELAVSYECGNHQPPHRVAAAARAEYENEQGCRDWKNPQYSALLEKIAAAADMLGAASADFYAFGEATGKGPRSNWMPADLYAWAGYPHYPSDENGMPPTCSLLRDHFQELGFQSNALADAPAGAIIVSRTHAGILVRDGDSTLPLVLHAAAKGRGVLKLARVDFVFPETSDPAFLTPNPEFDFTRPTARIDAPATRTISLHGHDRQATEYAKLETFLNNSSK
jgi:hypothetical protein